MPTDLSIKADSRRDTTSGAQVYRNCLAYALACKAKVRRLVDACAPYFAKFEGEKNFVVIMQKVFAHVNWPKIEYQVAGTSERVPTRYAQQIVEGRLIGVGQDDAGDLHFYVVTSSNGDGQGICGVIDAQSNTVLPCRLRGRTLIQHSGTGAPQPYNLLGFIVVSWK